MWRTSNYAKAGIAHPTLPLQSPLTSLLYRPGGFGHLSGSHFTYYQQTTTDTPKVLQEETRGIQVLRQFIVSSPNQLLLS